MFNFGLFSSSIPYIVFVAVYLFYFSVQVFGREQETECRDNEAVAYYSFFSGETVIYLNEEVGDEEIRQNKHEVLYPLPHIKQLQPECVGRPYLGVPIHSFSRPPPFSHFIHAVLIRFRMAYREGYICF
jgi:hypothetical protein